MGSESANESAVLGEEEEGGGGWTGGYCLLGDLSSNTSRQAARAPGHGQRSEPVGS